MDLEPARHCLKREGEAPAEPEAGTSARRPRRAIACVVWSLLVVATFGSTAAWADRVPTTAEAVSPSRFEPALRIAAWPWQHGRRPRLSIVPRVPDTPHPAVARIIVPEDGVTAFGSGTLIDVREQFGLVVTNWHVVRDSQGTVEVVFPSGFRSHARPLKVDADWDLAALVIWRPPIEPVRVSQVPPRPGDRLTIHGYGQGRYRIATGRCSAFYAPKINFPQEMVELDVEARQGDSGGPIFNDRGELAGVLFGAGEGTTIGSFAPRVESFLATLAPDIGQANDQALVAVADRPAPEVRPRKPLLQQPVADGPVTSVTRAQERASAASAWPSSPWMPPAIAASTPQTPGSDLSSAGPNIAGARRNETVSWSEVTGSHWYDGLKSILAVVGLIAVAMQLVRIVK